MKDISRPTSLGLYVLVLLCFLLPFARVSCRTSETEDEGETTKVEKVLQATGYDVAFGKRDTVSAKQDWGTEARKPELLAIAILVATLVGIGLALLKGRRGAIIRAVYSDHCVLLVFALWAKLTLRVGQNGGILTMLLGYWATLALFTAAFVVNLVAIWFLPRAATLPSVTGIGKSLGEA